MRRLALVGLASLSTVALGGFLAGCGDNKARVADGGGTGGTDAGGDRIDMNNDRGETGSGGIGGADGGAAGAGGGICPAVSFVSPTNGQMLTAADDASGMACASGFKVNVTVSVTAANGTAVELHGAASGSVVASPPMLAAGTVMNNQVVFSAVQLAEGMTVLSVEIGGVPCAPKVTVSVACNLPTCTISAPSHDTLNGVLAPAGDRSSSAGSDYQAAFTVMTNIEDGQPVALTVTSLATPPAAPFTVSVNAMSGAATFAGVTLKPDGMYKIAAACTNRANAVGHSTNATYTVDSTPPTLTVDQPVNGATFGPTDLTNGAFKVCGTTTSTDAVNIPASAGTSMSNLCVQRGQTKGCVPVTTVNVSTCLNVACPGGPPFNLTVTLTDAAGNPQTQTITGISCASSLPAVQIVSPSTDAPNFADVTKRLLAATAGASQILKDADGTTTGAQTTVVACTDTMGGSARLYAGHRGDTTPLPALGAAVTVVAAVGADNCPVGLGFVARFAGVTLPESTEAADGSLTAATEIRVDVTDPVNTAAIGTSGPTDLWVDSIAPTLSEKTPTPLCGSVQASLGTFTTDIALNSTTAVVTLNVTNGTTAMFGPPTYVAGSPAGVATFMSVAFPQGQNVVVSTATEPSGNTSSLTPPIPMPMCTVTVGAAPIVSFTSPGPGQNLCANGNALATCVADSTPGVGAAAGWQGNIVAHVQTPGGVPVIIGNVSFTIAGGAAQMAALDASGNATLVGVTIADAAAVVLTATTDGVPSGTTMKTVIVDSVNPDAVAALAATVLVRRQTSFRLTWAAPTDNGVAVFAYDIRQATTPIVDNATFTAGTLVPYGGMPHMPGVAEQLDVSDRTIQTTYYFAIRASDIVGNTSPVATAPSVTALFNQTVLTPSAGGSATEAFGYTIDGSEDVTGDMKADLLVGAQGAGQKAYLYSGASFDPLNPTVAPAPIATFTGSTNQFGLDVAFAGDLDGDGMSEIAISAPQDGNGKIYIFKGRSSWSGMIDISTADYTIVGSAEYALGGKLMGYALARLGDFNGDTLNDFAIGTVTYGTGSIGRVDVVLGGTLPASPATINLAGAAPTAPPAQVITIDGDPAFAPGRFGISITSLVGASDMVMVVGASYAGTSTRGRVYSFRRQSPMLAGGSRLTFADANGMLEGSTNGERLGENLATLGIPGTGIPALGISATASTLATPASHGWSEFYLGSPAIPLPATPSLVLGNSNATNAADFFGTVLIGGGFSGSTTTMSVVGTSTSDIVIGGTKEGGTIPRLYIIDGTRFSGLSSPADAVSAAAVQVPLPAGLIAASRRSRGVADLDHDGYGDLAIGQNALGGTGQAVILW